MAWFVEVGWRLGALAKEGVQGFDGGYGYVAGCLKLWDVVERNVFSSFGDER